MAKVGDHAVVLGASMAGLVTARVLSDFFDTVTVVERDTLPDTAANRRGVPQGRHLHALLARGADVLDELFPGILNELTTGGVPYFDGQDLSKLHYNLGGHRAISTGSTEKFNLYLTSRPFLEHHVRRQVRHIANITVAEEHDVVDLTSTPDGARVTGARIVDRRSRHEATLAAELVVDATGRAARTPTWLEQLGYGRPVEDHVTMQLAYSSQLMRIRPGALHEMGVIVGVVPGRPTGMGFFDCEDGKSVMTVMGMAGRVPPREFSALCEWVEEFAPPHVLAAVRDAELIGDVAHHRTPCSQWRRYDKMRRFPKGLLVIGDAICSFNPIYGQGMTVAALEALALRDCLACGTDDLARRFFRAAARPIRQAWQLAAGGDLALPEIPGERSLITRLLNGYVDRVLAAAEFDAAVFSQFARVTSLMDPPTRLLRPAMLWRAASADYRRRHRRGEAVEPVGVAETIPI
ncbi:FAD-dependent oxidoreductase [Mycobacterium shimoidei]|uniref:FAD-dependent oxidoreductase n=1 Tax=Mycobacterium shimoidei TaxID=29313 RepID=UPI000849065C|nr:FAD-binding protein [Mycobacterium shimoidei]MCV7260724.1 FAD-binding protein [Mycobacterium shimoidei]ODR07881.1 2-polyprenyl-6-methoxyphenol hydroxylase-like oxidoreductase [Mycobacterium shimoidei]ORW80291.1 2-polyprenyl-6-methoxyphenol hydroxylase-like oxidoreductase [Mycobacterium shimoidei]